MPDRRAKLSLRTASACGLAALLVLSGCGSGSRGSHSPVDVRDAAIQPVPGQPPVGTFTPVTPGPMPPKEVRKPVTVGTAPPDSVHATDPKGGSDPAPGATPGRLPAFGEHVEVDEPALPITRVHALYPEEARARGVSGTVIVQALVGEDGRVLDTRISSSIPLLDEAARTAVLQWRFEPAKRQGKPVAVWFPVPVKFSLH